MIESSIFERNLDSENKYLITYKSTPLFVSFSEEKNSEDLTEIPLNLIKEVELLSLNVHGKPFIRKIESVKLCLNKHI